MSSFLILSPEEWLVLFGAFVALGGVAGFLAGLLGIGGGIVLVPGLYMIFEMLGLGGPHIMHICVGTALAIIVPTGLSSARAHFKKGALDFVLLKTIGIGILIGVLAGTMLANILSGAALRIFFAVMLGVLGAFMFLVDPTRLSLWKQVPAQPLPTIVGSIIGTISTLVGIGGATMSVPFMTLSGVHVRRAIGTAAGLGIVISLPATLGFMMIGWGVEARPPLSIGFVNLPAWACIVPLSVLSARVGAAAMHRLPVSLLRRGFALFMVMVSLKMLWGVL